MIFDAIFFFDGEEPVRYYDENIHDVLSDLMFTLGFGIGANLLAEMSIEIGRAHV